MPTYYTDAPAEVADIAAKLIAKHYPDVQEVETRITYKFAWSVAKDGEEQPEPPLKLHGVPCLALIRLVSYRNRVCGMDVTRPVWAKSTTAASTIHPRS